MAKLSHATRRLKFDAPPSDCNEKLATEKQAENPTNTTNTHITIYIFISAVYECKKHNIPDV